MNEYLYADLYFYHGQIITVDTEFRICQAVAVKGDRILAVGTEEEVGSFCGEHTQRIDLKGATMLPGINDAHLHLAQAGLCIGKGLSRGEVIMRQEPWSDQEIREAYIAVLDACRKLGVTSVTEGDIGTKYNTERGGIAGIRSLSILNDLLNEDMLSARINLMLSYGPDHGDDCLEYLQEGIDSLGFHTGFGNTMLRIAGIKFFADGVTGLKTGFMSVPFNDDSNGKLLIKGETEQERHDELVRMIEYAHEKGFQVGIHCCGDKAIDAVADGYLSAKEKKDWDSRDYYIHGDLISDETIRRTEGKGIGYSAFMPALWEKIGALKDGIGYDRACRLYPIRTLIDHGFVVSSHTDYPFTFTDWRLGIQMCLTREAPDGTVYGADECVSIEDAIRIYTINGAWQTGEDKIKGSIEPGKLADLCVIGEDILTVEPHTIKDIPVMMTVLGGNVIYNTL